MSTALCLLAAFGCAAETESEREAQAVPQTTLIPSSAPVAPPAAPTMQDMIAACIASHPPSDPFEVGDVPLPRAGTMAPPLPPPLVRIAETCRQDGGTDCEPEGFMSKQAAECIATLHGFPEDAKWNISLSYFEAAKRVVWSLMYSVLDPSGDSAVGRRIVLDAINGNLLGDSPFRVVP